MAVPLPAHEEKFIRSYVEAESQNADDANDPDTKVTLVQKVSSYRLLGTDYDVYDVHMPKERWWVITEPTNLYSQETFPNYDVAFSFHVGLMLRVMNRERVEIKEEKVEEVGAAWRRFEAAVAAMDSAREAEDYQGVAIKCREALLAFGREHQEAEWLTLPEVKCKINDFKGWAKLYAQELSTGRMRRYLSEIAEKAWDVSVSLQHDYNATEWDAEMLLDATAHVLQMYSTAIVKVKRKPPRRCPKCSSYRLVTDGDIAERDGEQGWLQAEVCSACGYRGPESFSAWERVAADDDDLEVEPAE
jgi:hypothetical protein